MDLVTAGHILHIGHKTVQLGRHEWLISYHLIDVFRLFISVYLFDLAGTHTSLVDEIRPATTPATDTRVLRFKLLDYL